MKLIKSKMVIACILTITLLLGVTGCYQVQEPVATNSEVKAETETPADATVPENSESEAPELDFEKAATELGITEQEIMDAMGDPNDGPPDIAAVAEALNTTEEIIGMRYQRTLPMSESRLCHLPMTMGKRIITRLFM